MTEQIITKLGFGCGRIVGGASIKESSAILTSAYDMGIRHFDVAPSYGLGTAEDALGCIFDGEKTVKIATKVGIARPSGAAGLSILRKYLGPLIKSSKFLSSLATKSLANNVERGLFDAQFVQRSIEDSLRRLKRTEVDYLLLHEPQNENLTESLTKLLEELVMENTVKEIGMGFNSSKSEQIAPFGSVIQKNIGQLDLSVVSEYKKQIVHGVFRYGIEQIPQILNRNKYILGVLDTLKVKVDTDEYYAAIALALAAKNPHNHLILISYSNIERMLKTLIVAEDIYSELKICNVY